MYFRGLKSGVLTGKIVELLMRYAISKKNSIWQIQLRFIIGICLLFVGNHTALLHAQYAKGFTMEAAMHDTDLDTELFFDLALKYDYWFNRFTGVSFGGMVNFSKMDSGFGSPVNDNVRYELDDFVLNFSGIIGMKFATPTFKGFGLECDLNLLVAPVPFNLVSVDKRTYVEEEDKYNNTYKMQVVYTHFNPAYSMQASVFYQKRGKSKITRISLGAGLSNYNPYNVYYRASIEDIELKNHLHLKPSKQSYMIFLRLSGLNLIPRKH